MKKIIVLTIISFCNHSWHLFGRLSRSNYIDKNSKVNQINSDSLNVFVNRWVMFKSNIVASLYLGIATLRFNCSYKIIKFT